MEETDKVGSMSDKDNVGCRLGRSLASDCLFVEIVTGLVNRTKEVVVEWHKETKVGVDTAVVQGMVAWSVDDVLDARDSHEPARDKLKVAMANGVHDVKANEVDVEHGHGSSTLKEWTDHGNAKVGRVHEMFHEGMDGSGDGFGHKTGVVMRMVSRVEPLVVKCSMKPVVDELGGSNVPPEHLPQSRSVVEREVTESKLW